MSADPSPPAPLAYCFKCRAKHPIQSAQAVFLANGSPAVQGRCPSCGTRLTRMGRTPDHESLPKPAPALGSGRLVIVESPAKARTVGRFLGGGYQVRASVGHIRDLPSNRMGVDLENGFAPHYVIPASKAAVVKGLRLDASKTAEVYLATDPDREGEAISWHLRAALDKAIAGKPVRRVVFHEITRGAVEEAFAHSRDIDLQLVDAQQARRVLDRVVGYSLSPLLRRKLSGKGYSAGRVQSVAVRMVVDREREIRAFVPVEYWSIEVELAKLAPGPDEAHPAAFRASLVRAHGDEFECHRGEDALALGADLERCAYAVLDVRRKEVRRYPSPPFTTSTLQQEASRKLGFTARRTMAVAQQLYEGLAVGSDGNVGLITYMRTDSTNVAEAAQSEARSYIAKHFGQAYVPAKPRVYKTRAKGAQEAHEAIRPTSVLRKPAGIKAALTNEQLRLYALIWKRFVASQMEAAILDTTAVDIGADLARSPVGNPNPPYLLRANGSVVKFKGFMQVYVEDTDDAAAEESRRLPDLASGEELRLLGVFPDQHFTEPPPRYTEASLVKAMEELGIGRPSTYAPTLATIQERDYVQRIDGRRLAPTELGFLVTDLLVKHFPEVLDLGFTAQMEERLDEIASGDRAWVPVLQEFYGPFKEALDRAETDMETVEVPVELTDQLCDKCGSPMMVKRSRYGKFLACSAFPNCRNAKPLVSSTGARCPKCGGDLVEKRTRKGRTFYSCSKYPACKFALWKRPRREPCPACGGLLVEVDRAGKRLTCQKCGQEISTERMRPSVDGTE